MSPTSGSRIPNTPCAACGVSRETSRSPRFDLGPDVSRETGEGASAPSPPRLHHPCSTRSPRERSDTRVADFASLTRATGPPRPCLLADAEIPEDHVEDVVD